MTRFAAALLAVLFVLPAAAFQDDMGGEPRKDDPKKLEEDAKAALKAYRDKRNKAGNKEEEFVDAVSLLKDAKPHRLIRAELITLVESKFPYSVRTRAAEALAEYKKDVGACDSLVRRARMEKGADALDFRKRCLRTFSDISPFAKSMDLQQLFSDPDTAVARAAIESAENIASVRMLPTLIALWGELDRIRDDDGKDPGKELPGGGMGKEDNNSRRKRKEDLLEPAKKAVNALWKKVDSKKELKTYTDAAKGLNEKRSDIKKLQDEEDRKDEKDKSGSP